MKVDDSASRMMMIKNSLFYQEDKKKRFLNRKNRVFPAALPPQRHTKQATTSLGQPSFHSFFYILSEI
jgi:hypothetical protein